MTLSAGRLRAVASGRVNGLGMRRMSMRKEERESSVHCGRLGWRELVRRRLVGLPRQLAVEVGVVAILVVGTQVGA